MVSSGMNDRETYFEFPELTKLQGKPNAESLYKLRNELKATARAVTSSLSDGAHGHLALVLSGAQYALLTDQPFVRPVHPGPLIIATATSNALTTVKKMAHDEAIRLFREVQGVKKALVQQIVQAIAAPYLSSIRDRTSATLSEELSTKSLSISKMSTVVSHRRCLKIATTNYVLAWYTTPSCPLTSFSTSSRTMLTSRIWPTRL
jgi:hypothetical protein